MSEKREAHWADVLDPISCARGQRYLRCYKTLREAWMAETNPFRLEQAIAYARGYSPMTPITAAQRRCQKQFDRRVYHSDMRPFYCASAIRAAYTCPTLAQLRKGLAMIVKRRAKPCT